MSTMSSQTKIAVLLRGEPRNFKENAKCWNQHWVHKDADVKFFGSIVDYEGMVFNQVPRTNFEQIAEARLFSNYKINKAKDVCLLAEYFNSVLYRIHYNDYFDYTQDTGKSLFDVHYSINQVYGSFIARSALHEYVTQNNWHPDYVIDTRYDLNLNQTNDLSMVENLDKFHNIHTLPTDYEKFGVPRKHTIYVENMSYNFHISNAVWIPDWLFVQTYDHQLFGADIIESMKRSMENTVDFVKFLSSTSRAHFMWVFFNQQSAFVQHSFPFGIELNRGFTKNNTDSQQIKTSDNLDKSELRRRWQKIIS